MPCDVPQDVYSGVAQQVRSVTFFELHRLKVTQINDGTFQLQSMLQIFTC